MVFMDSSEREHQPDPQPDPEPPPELPNDPLRWSWDANGSPVD